MLRFPCQLLKLAASFSNLLQVELPTVGAKYLTWQMIRLNQRMLCIIGIESFKAAPSLFIHNCMLSNIYVHTISSSDTGTNILGKKY